MSATTKIWVNGAAPTCDDADLNGFKAENNNLIVGSGQSLNTGDNQQTHRAVSHYATVGDFYVDSGVVNTYVLSVTGTQVAPPTYATGMRFRFVAGTTNTSTSTANVSALGVKPILSEIGAALVAGQIVAGQEYMLRYNGTYLILGAPLQKTGGTIVRHSAQLGLKSSNDSTIDIESFDNSDVIRAMTRHSISTGNTTFDVRNAAGAVQGTAPLKQNGNMTVSGAAPLVAADLTRKDWVESQIAAAVSGLVLLDEQIISVSTTNVDFIASMDGTYDEYVLKYTNVVPVGTAVMSARVYTGAATLQSGVADYKTGAATSSLMQLAANISSTVALGGLNGSITLMNVNQAGQYTMLDVETSYEQTTGAVAKAIVGQSFQQTALVTGIRFYGQTSNIASGIFRLYGLTK